MVKRTNLNDIKELDIWIKNYVYSFLIFLKSLLISN